MVIWYRGNSSGDTDTCPRGTQNHMTYQLKEKKNTKIFDYSAFRKIKKSYFSESFTLKRQNPNI